MLDLLFEVVPAKGLPATDRVVLTNRKNHFLIRMSRVDADVNGDGIDDQINLKTSGWLCDKNGKVKKSHPIPGRVDSISLESVPMPDDVTAFITDSIAGAVFRAERMVSARAVFDLIPA